MSLANYTDLQAALVDWLKDSALSAQADVFISLVEAQFNRQLRVPEMEAFTTLTTATDSVALPDDFLEIKAIWTGRYPPLGPMPIYDLQTSFGPVEETVQQTSFSAYAIVGSTIHFGLTPAESTDFSFHYYRKVPSLTADSPTNWLMTSHPDAYLYGALTTAEMRGWNDERLPLLQSWFADTLAQITKAGVKKTYGGGPLVPRSGLTPVYGARN